VQRLTKFISKEEEMDLAREDSGLDFEAHFGKESMRSETNS
jgi:hypothetical protein